MRLIRLTESEFSDALSAFKDFAAENTEYGWGTLDYGDSVSLVSGFLFGLPEPDGEGQLVSVTITQEPDGMPSVTLRSTDGDIPDWYIRELGRLTGLSVSLERPTFLFCDHDLTRRELNLVQKSLVSLSKASV